MTMTPNTTGDSPTATVAAEKATAVADTAQANAASVAEEAKGKAADVATEARDHARDLMSESRSTLRSQAEVQGEQLSSTAKSLASEMKSMARASDGQLAGLIDQGADQLSRVATRFDRDGLDAVSGDARRFARQRPVVFLASTFAAGFAAGRLLKHADNDELKDAVTE